MSIATGGSAGKWVGEGLKKVRWAAKSIFRRPDKVSGHQPGFAAQKSLAVLGLRSRFIAKP